MGDLTDHPDGLPNGGFLTPVDVLVACTVVQALERTAEAREAAVKAFDEAGCFTANDVFILPDMIISTCIEGLDEVTKHRFRNVVSFYRDTEEDCIASDIDRLILASMVPSRESVCVC